MKLFNFWQKWILVTGIIIILMALTFPVYIYFNVELKYINSAFWENGNIPADVIPFKNWLFGVYCALSVVFGIFVIFISAIPFKRKEKWAWICLSVCYTLWLGIDTSYSISYGVISNAINNIILYIILIIPLIFTSKNIFRNKQANLTVSENVRN